MGSSYTINYTSHGTDTDDLPIVWYDIDIHPEVVPAAFREQKCYEKLINSMLSPDEGTARPYVHFAESGEDEAKLLAANVQHVMNDESIVIKLVFYKSTSFMSNWVTLLMLRPESSPKEIDYNDIDNTAAAIYGKKFQDIPPGYTLLGIATYVNSTSSRWTVPSDGDPTTQKIYALNFWALNGNYAFALSAISLLVLKPYGGVAITRDRARRNDISAAGQVLLRNHKLINKQNSFYDDEVGLRFAVASNAMSLAVSGCASDSPGGLRVSQMARDPDDPFYRVIVERIAVGARDDLTQRINNLLNANDNRIQNVSILDIKAMIGNPKAAVPIVPPNKARKILTSQDLPSAENDLTADD